MIYGRAPPLFTANTANHGISLGPAGTAETRLPRARARLAYPSLGQFIYTADYPVSRHPPKEHTHMLQKLVIAIAIFLVILLALTFGESVARHALEWFQYLTGIVIHNFSDIYNAITGYVSQHTGKVLLALALTVPITIWVIRNKDVEQTHNRRKIAIVLAIFLGWLGAHRFYLGQVGRGLLYLLLFYFFPPILVILLSLIDAVRYWFMGDDVFQAPSQIKL